MTIVTSSLASWQPTDSEPWNLQRVWHLHRRAGFGATWHELQRDLREGPEAAVDRIVAGVVGLARVPSAVRSSGNSGEFHYEKSVAEQHAEFEQMSSVICDAAVGSGNINRLKAWWLYRMLKTPNPLHERLTLAWHNHFATSNIKVQDVGMMRRQNDSLREHSVGRFEYLLRSMAHDPAVLVWLDADANRKEHPNENLAREIMELFTLGVGNYSEEDIKEAARALTGWTVKQGDFLNVAKRHDAGEKTIFGQTGKWNGDDFVTLLLEHSATPRRIALRVCELLMGESKCEGSLVEELAVGLVEHDLDIGWAIETVLRSKAFFAAGNIRNRVLSPVEFVVGAIRCLEINSPLPSTLLLAETTANLGQDLFNPPNVFGWPGGRSWLTSRAIIGRSNFASALINGELHSSHTPFDAAVLAERHNVCAEKLLPQLLLGLELPTGMKPLKKEPNQLVTAILSSPEAFLG